MKRSLHQGKSFTLNLYFVDLAHDGLLGYTTFPWRYHVHPRLDGVVVAYNTVPGGRLKPYDEGDTAVHEVGHWLGLLHTFQGGCEGSGDGVADTPAEAAPQYRCDTTADTCPSPGLDPVHNFMDYSLDSCMDQFTAGQAARMFSAWATFRQRR
ncbi:zinc metalloprotease [Nocardioides mangrovicus]|uniref:Zinc metalloprotease n=2 Tax=Nocardioides mangrovicus TaxID=2478913 RepID=A0A3L8P6W5_9ACTN|nr:zinc metalloprotease [Nocardioides mangrovicus]